MKAILGIIFEVIENIVETAIEICPPLLILVIAAFLFFGGGGCLAKIFGALLIPIGIIVLVIWLFM